MSAWQDRLTENRDAKWWTSTGNGTHEVGGLVSWGFANNASPAPAFDRQHRRPEGAANGAVALRILFSDDGHSGFAIANDGTCFILTLAVHASG